MPHTVPDPGDTIRGPATGVDLEVYTVELNKSDGSHMVTATKDGQPVGGEWCQCEDSPGWVWYEDITYRNGHKELTPLLSHGIVCTGCRGILQIG